MIKRVKLDKANEEVKKFFKKFKEENQYIVEIKGKPLLGIVPSWQIEQMKQSKKELRAMLQEVWAKTRNIPEEEIEKLVDEAVKAVRSESYDESRP